MTYTVETPAGPADHVVMDEKFTARYTAYATAHGNTPEQQLTADRVRWPGGHMAGFIVWIDEKWREFGRPQTITDEVSVAFDAWLVTS